MLIIRKLCCIAIEVLEIEGALPEKAECKIAIELCTNHPLGLY